ncbi:putative E3 ubiquitin ligase complex SCF subunit sconB [Lineolata rhizophorae]|uniref:Putative E3 ubiquitin ligase complex SCF subunit sconB n=1 Tax=Lineolata rhizophorae TaxID=578093 RepID=A0A6A6NR51_9PEZI|nr:putative E3 ubiquitin ligase complex SCF subunit sconB [Lineolata rhizophorae]
MKSADTLQLLREHEHGGGKSRRNYDDEEREDDGPSKEEKDRAISISTSSKQAERAVAPFLAIHIPQQYNPLGSASSLNSSMASSNSKYCYRHRPDLKCRRQANEPSMEQLQSELNSLSEADQQAIAHVWSLFSAAPSKHRNLMLEGILAQCCFPQLSMISASVRELIKIDFLSALPPELGFKILSYLDTTSLCKAAQVSRRWRTMADDDVVWHKMCEQHIDRKCTKCGWGLPLLERKRLRTEKRQNQIRASRRGLNEWSPNITPVPEPTRPDEPRQSSAEADAPNQPAMAGTKRSAHSGTASAEPVSKKVCNKKRWKDVYKDRFMIGTNWKYGRCTTKVFRGHSNGVMCLQFDDNILATGSYDSTIKIWDMKSGKEIRTLTGHTSGIRCLQFDDAQLISGGLDCTLKIWNWRTGECIRTLTGHSSGIINLHFENNILASGSMDKSIRIWNIQDRSTFLLRGHTDWVNAVKVDTASRTVFSASDDCTIRLWDLDTRRCLKVFEGHVGQVQQVLPLPHEFEIHDIAEHHDAPGDDGNVSDSSGASSYLQNSGNDAPRNSQGVSNALLFASNQSYAPFFEPGTISTRPLPPRYMLTGSLDNTIRLWDVARGRCIRTFFGHLEGVWALAGDTLRFVSGAEDRMVKVWDPQTGRCDRTFTGHTGPVTCLGLSDSRLVSGSEDGDVRLYSFTPECKESP